LFGKADVALLTNPAFEVLLVAIAVRLRRIPFHYRVHDLYPEIAIRLGLIRRNGLVARSIDRLERACLAWSKTVSVVTPAFKRFLVRADVPAAKIAVVPDWADPISIRVGCKDNPFSRRHGVVDKFVVGYGGNVGRSQGLEHFLNAAACLQDDDRIRFLVIGEGASRAALISRAKAMQLKNVAFLPYQPAATLSDVYASWDVGFVSLAPGVSPEWCTGKVYTIMASARPVLAAVDHRGEVHQLLSRSGCGVRVEPGNAAQLAAAIRKLLHARSELTGIGLRGRAMVERAYSREVCTKQLIGLIESTADSAAPTPQARPATAVLLTDTNSAGVDPWPEGEGA
jgi:glycosyltransferase involved in cell wall biosynthesis